MRYEDFEKDTAYLVADGYNDTLQKGDVFWIESAYGSVCLAGKQCGWIDKEDIGAGFFTSLTVCKDNRYAVTTRKNGDTRLERT